MTIRKRKVSPIIIASLVLLVSSIASAGDVDVNSSGTSGKVLEVLNFGSSANRIAVFGAASQTPGAGTGGQFVGGGSGVVGFGDNEGVTGNGEIGVAGYSIISGDFRVGGYFTSGYSPVLNYGAFGSSDNPSAGWNLGITGTASGGAINTGVYGSAPTGGFNSAGFFNGDLYHTGSFGQVSDGNAKTDIEDLDGALEQLMELKPKTFRYRTGEIPEMNLPEGYHMGLVAQDLEKVFPEMVSNIVVTDMPNPESKDKELQPKKKNFLAVNYVELIPVLVKAIQEQQNQIEELQYEVATLTGNY